MRHVVSAASLRGVYTYHEYAFGRCSFGRHVGRCSLSEGWKVLDAVDEKTDGGGLIDVVLDLAGGQLYE